MSVNKGQNTASAHVPSNCSRDGDARQRQGGSVIAHHQRTPIDAEIGRVDNHGQPPTGGHADGFVFQQVVAHWRAVVTATKVSLKVGGIEAVSVQLKAEACSRLDSASCQPDTIALNGLGERVQQGRVLSIQPQ